MNQVISSFNAGELSPFVDGRSNLDQYRRGCRTLENYLPTPDGPVHRRAGTQYIGTAKVSTTKIRLIPLNFSDNNKFIAEIGVGYIRFWTGGVTPAQVVFPNAGSWTLFDSVTPTTPDTVTYTMGQIVEAVPVDYLGNYISGGTPVPYQESELDGVNFITVGNVAYLTHPNYFPIRISFYGFNNPEKFPPFTSGEVPWKWPAMLSQNTSDSIILTTTGYIGHGNVTLSISGTTATLSSPDIPFTGTTNFTVTAATVFGQTNAALGYHTPLSVSAGTMTYAVPSGTTVPLGIMVCVSYTPNTSGLSSGTSVYLISSDNIFSSGHVNSYWEIDHTNPTAGIFFPLGTTTAPASTTPSASIKCFGSWTLSTWGNWTGLISLQQSPDKITWNTIRTYYSNTDNAGGKNFTDNGDTGDDLQYFRIVVSSSTVSISNSPYCSFTPNSATLKGWVKINNVIAPNFAQATIGSDLGVGSPTTQWYEGAFSDVQGYPQAVGLHESRVVFGGTKLNPTGIWGSAVNDFQNFLQGALDSNSYQFTLASNTGGRIQWIVSQGAMAVGTTQDEWLLTSSSTASSALTPSNVSAQKQSHYGSSSVPAALINDTIIYIQRMGRKVREFAYNWQITKWISNELSALSEQATRNLITERSYQRVPDATLWMIRGDGQVATMLYEREQQVTAFARHTTDGLFESVAIMPGLTAEDEIWFSVKRTINGATKRYVERIALGQRDALDTSTNASWWYLDCGKYQTSVNSKTVTGLSHLEGKSVAVWADGYDAGRYTVTSGTITLNQTATNVLVGLLYTSTLSPMRIVADLQTGNSMGRKQSINEVNVHLYNSIGGQVSADGVNFYPLDMRQMSDPLDVAPPTNNGWTRAIVNSNIDDYADIVIKQSDPMPLSVVAIAAGWDVTEQD
jgi:hypothetical protein